MSLSRVDLDDAGDDPVRLASYIHLRVQLLSGPVPVCQIATELDIAEIWSRPLRSMEGCLITQPERTDGSILVNSNSSTRRQRFTIAHGLGHFLMLSHTAGDNQRFTCRSEDMVASGNVSKTNHYKRQEAEANLFAINLLAPASRCQRFLKRIPDLANIAQLAEDLEISREAAARRYVELHPARAAVVFARAGKVIYATRNSDFPFITLTKDDPLPPLRFHGEHVISDHVETDAEDWLGHAWRHTLVAQRLVQESGHEMILLAFDAD